MKMYLQNITVITDKGLYVNLFIWDAHFFFYIKHLHVKHKKYSHQVYITDIPEVKKHKTSAKNKFN